MNESNPHLQLIDLFWVTMYTGYPNRIRAYQGSVFAPDRWRQITIFSGLQLKISRVKIQSSLGIVERLHSPLRIINNKITHAHTTRPKIFAINIALKSMNGTIGETG